MDTESDWQRLATLIKRRRIEELGLTQEEVAGRGGPSTATQRLLEGALQTSYRPRTLRDVDNAMEWAPGSARTVLQGGEPTPKSQMEANALRAVLQALEGPPKIEEELVGSGLHPENFEAAEWMRLWLQANEAAEANKGDSE